MQRFSRIVCAGITLAALGHGGLTPALAGGLDAEDADTSVSGHQAIEQLLDSAADFVGQRQFEPAAAALERALRIEPGNPEIWHLLGQVRLHQGQHQQAEAMAEKSNSLSDANAGLRERNAQVIAIAQQMASGQSLPVPQLPAAAQPEQHRHEAVPQPPVELVQSESDDAAEQRMTIPITRYTLEESPVAESQYDRISSEDAPRFTEQDVLLIAQPSIEPGSDVYMTEERRRVWQEQQNYFTVDDLSERLRARSEGIRIWIARADHRAPHYRDDGSSGRRYDEVFDDDRRYYDRDDDRDFDPDRRPGRWHRPEHHGNWGKYKKHKHAGKRHRSRHARGGRW